jgi:uncharacterized protein
MNKILINGFFALVLLGGNSLFAQESPVNLKNPNLQGTTKPLKANVNKPLSQRDVMSENANANTVTIISGNVTGSFIAIANDISFTLDDGDKMRILPIIGKGAEQNLYDILLLRGVDIGIVRSDGLEALKADKRLPNAASQIAYILRLFSDEAHLMVGKNITDIKELAGKKVSFDLKGSGANYSGRLLFERLGIAVIPLNMDNNQAYEKLKTGELDGVFQWASKPINAVAKFAANDKFHLIDIPYDPRISDLYSPASLEASLYPNLLSKDKVVSTLSASSILAVYNWPKDTERHKKVAKFVDSMFNKIEEFHKPGRHPKWLEVNINATVPGWKRFPAAQEWLDKNSGAPPAGQSSREDFQKFLNEKGGAAPQSKADTDRLFDDFQNWQKRKTR